MKKLGKHYRDAEGKLLTHAEGYPIFYLDSDDSVLCPKCAIASEEEEPQLSMPIVASDVNWENPTLYCDQCSKRIPSAYAEDDEEENSPSQEESASVDV